MPEAFRVGMTPIKVTILVCCGISGLTSIKSVVILSTKNRNTVERNSHDSKRLKFNCICDPRRSQRHLNGPWDISGLVSIDHFDVMVRNSIGKNNTETTGRTGIPLSVVKCGKIIWISIVSVGQIVKL
jgi:hypothetical protein